jgi:FkbM family methyltransferase
VTARTALRSMLERLSRNRVVRRRLPPELGGATLLVSPDSSMKLWRRDLRRADPLLFEMARELVRPGATVWDIGANVGLFAAAAAYLAGPSGRVLAVEADAWLAGLLTESFLGLSAAYAPIEVLSAAAAGAAGVAAFCTAKRGRATNHLASVAGSTQTGGTRAVREVATVTLDGLLERFAAPQVVKIDVEGAELDCLRGARALLARAAPALLCEVAADHAPEVGRLLQDAGYTLYDAALPAAARQLLATPAWNTLALPAGWSPAGRGEPR